MTASETSGVLAEIVRATTRELDERRRHAPLAMLERLAARREPRGAAFRAAISGEKGDSSPFHNTADSAAKTGGKVPRYSVIAECKRRSPSRGLLCDNYDPAAIARSYAEAGAAAISVLTEPSFFDGSLRHLECVRAAVTLPVLRKDFIVDEYQVVEARAAGADAVLLIAAVLGADRLSKLVRFAGSQELEALVEAHDEDELARALGAGATVVGINNRNLRTLEVNLETSLRLIEMLPEGIASVAESGIRQRTDIERLRTAGFNAFLVGEQLMTAPDPGRALRELLGGHPCG